MNDPYRSPDHGPVLQDINRRLNLLEARQVRPKAPGFWSKVDGDSVLMFCSLGVPLILISLAGMVWIIVKAFQ